MKNWYLEYAIKKPYFFFLFILMGVSLILVLLLNTTVPVINTYSVRLDKYQGEYFLSCDKPIFDSDIKSIFVYVDKNEKMYQLSNYVVVSGKKIYIPNKNLSNILTKNNTKDFHIDISKHNVTLFREIFVHGGKN